MTSPSSEIAKASHRFARRVLWGIAWFAIALTTTERSDAVGFLGLGDLPGGMFESLALGVSDDGKIVVGTGNSLSGEEAFRWTSGGGMVGLGDLPGGVFSSDASAASADGSVVVGLSTPASGLEAFRWTSGGGMVGLGDLAGGTFLSHAEDISADGSVVVGRGTSASGSEAFRWTSGGGMVGLGDLPGGAFSGQANGVSADGSVVVGASSSASGSEAFRWTSGGGMVGLGDLPGGAFSSGASAASADGSVVVGRGTSASGPEVFRWTSGGGMVGLGDLAGGSFSSFAPDVSSDGSVIVGRGTTADGIEAFIWDATNGMRNLREVLSASLGATLIGWTLVDASGISEDGRTVVGRGTNANGQTEAWLAYLSDEISWLPQTSGAWDSTPNWSGPFLPGPADNVTITPTQALTVTGPSASQTVKSLALGGGAGVVTLRLDAATADVRTLETSTIGPNGELSLANGATFAAPFLSNSGIIRGDGVLETNLTVSSGGELRTGAGERLHVISDFGVNNLGGIEAIGSAVGPFEIAEIEFKGLVANAGGIVGSIVARNAVLRFNDGLVNGGVVTVTFGATDVFGDVQNVPSGTIAVAGNSGVTFYDDVTNNGTLNVAAGSTAVFFGALSGNGNVGAGDVQALGDLLPGSSPGLMQFGGDLTLGPLTAPQIELGGLTPGVDYDRLEIGGVAMIDGDLDVRLINGFVPAPTDTFLVFNASSLLGVFDNIGNGQRLATSDGVGSFHVHYGVGSAYDPDQIVLTNFESAFTADFDNDGDVDGEDLAQWQGDFGANALSDADNDNDSDGYDFLAWQRQLGSGPPATPAAAAVPEPGALLLICVCGCLLLAIQIRR